jgi:hypothetical protein
MKAPWHWLRLCCSVVQAIAVRGLPIAVYRPAQPTQATENDRLRHHE